MRKVEPLISDVITEALRLKRKQKTESKDTALGSLKHGCLEEEEEPDLDSIFIPQSTLRSFNRSPRLLCSGRLWVQPSQTGLCNVTLQLASSLTPKLAFDFITFQSPISPAFSKVPVRSALIPGWHLHLVGGISEVQKGAALSFPLPFPCFIDITPS